MSEFWVNCSKSKRKRYYLTQEKKSLEENDLCQGDENPAVSNKVYADIAKLLDPGENIVSWWDPYNGFGFKVNLRVLCFLFKSISL